MLKRKRVFIMLLVAAAFTVGFGATYAASTPNFHSLDLERDFKQFLSVPDAPTALHDIVSDMTVEAWVNLESKTCGDAMTIASKRTEPADVGWVFELVNSYPCATTQISFSVSGNGKLPSANTMSNALAIENGVWHHFAATYEASAGKAQFYFDGESAGYATGLPTGIFAGASDFRIGARAHSADTEKYMDGMVDEVRVWNDVRTAEEIAGNFQKELTGDEAGLVGYWNFNGSAEDQTAEGNSFSGADDSTFTSDVPFFFALDSTQGEMIEGLVLPDKARPAK